MTRLLNYLKLLLAAVLMLSGEIAVASCTARASLDTIVLPETLSIARDTPVGGILYDSGWTGPATDAYVQSCAGGTDHWSYGYSSPMTPTGLDGVYETGIAGIGIKTAWSNTRSIQPADINGAMILQWPQVDGGVLPKGAYVYTPPSLYRIQFIKIGPVASGTMTLPNPTATTIYGGAISNQTDFTNSSVVIQAMSCSVRNNNIAVKLPEVSTHSFHAVGDVSGATGFNIALVCDAGVKVAYQLDGTAVASGAAGVIANQTGGGMATGVGVRVLQNNTPVSLGTLSDRYITTSIASQIVNIPFIAEYYKTAPQMSAGGVTATAVYTMNYQ
jgi:type 1 fimbria pilin